MAIRSRYGKWQVYYRHPITKKIVSQTFERKEDAEKENSLLSYRLQYDRGSFNTQTKGGHNTGTEANISKTFEVVYLEYLQERQFSKKNMASHFAHMKDSLEFLGTKNVDNITEKDVKNFQEKLKTSSIKNTTKNKRMAFLRTILLYAHDKGYCDKIEFPRRIKAAYEKFVPPSQEEIAQMLAVAQPYMQRIIIIGVYCGTRIGNCELFQLTWNDVDFQKKLLRVHGAKKNIDEQYREVPIRESLMPLFEQWYRDDQQSGHNFLIHNKKMRVTRIDNEWKQMLKKAGIKRRIRPYDLRHAFGTELVAAGVDVGTVAKLMGHSSPTMLLNHYQYVMDRQKKEAVELLPDLCMSTVCRGESQTPEKPHQ